MDCFDVFFLSLDRCIEGLECTKASILIDSKRSRRIVSFYNMTLACAVNYHIVPLDAPEEALVGLEVYLFCSPSADNLRYRLDLLWLIKA